MWAQPPAACSERHFLVSCSAQSREQSVCAMQIGTQQAQAAAAHAEAVAAAARTTRELRAEQQKTEALTSQLDSLRAQSATAASAASEAASAAATEHARLEVRHVLISGIRLSSAAEQPAALPHTWRAA